MKWALGATAATMPAKNINIDYAHPKERRSALRLIGEFAVENSILPVSRKLIRQRGLSIQYRGSGPHSYFPTEEAWRAFVDFTKLVHRAEPFASRSTFDDTHAALTHALADMLSAGLLPETPEDLVQYLPSDFKLALVGRWERAFSKAQGISIEFEGFVQIGSCWLGEYRNLDFEAIPESPNGHKEDSLQSLSECFEHDSAVIASARNPGTSDRVDLESAYQCELALSILCVLLNLSYRSAFGNLWQIRRVRRPEDGLSKELSFSIIHPGGTTPAPQIGMRMAFRERRFKVGQKIVDMWHNSLGLGICNRLVTDPRCAEIDLFGNLVSAMLNFRLATRQSAPEMKMVTLWICVESLLTNTAENILEANLPGLLATTVASMSHDHWPDGATTLDELRRTFKRYYDYRSRAIHQGRRGHVSEVDVQEFSVVVSGLIVNVVCMIPGGVRTIGDLSHAFQRMLDGARTDNSNGDHN